MILNVETLSMEGRLAAPPLSNDLGRVLCVDLDGSLLATDLLHESFLALVRARPWEALLVPVWLASGKARLKRELAERTSLDVATLPYNEDVVAFLRREHIMGRRIVLATAADERFARAVADNLGCFDEVLCSDGRTNLKGVAKLEAIEGRYGRGGFDYLGNGPEDLPIWEASARNLLVRPGRRLIARVRSMGKPVDVFEQPEGRLRSCLRMLRVHQWLKNLLLIVPLITAHRLGEWPLLLAALVAFLSFSSGASSIYILNDLMDLPSDRLHPSKRRRPLASGAISIPVGLASGMALLAASIALACVLPPGFLGLLLLYLTTSSLYTLWFKRTLLLDVICLAGLYTLRILAGGAATGIVITPWLMAFSMFLFLSLALVKRFTELLSQGELGQYKLPGRGYGPVDLDMIRSLGLASGCLSVLVIGLYLRDEPIASMYQHPQRLWFLCPVVLYWIMRVWFLAQRGHLHHDPVVFALGDRNSLIAGLICGLILFAGTV
jgi:4-hydroxybenzoate polyprenyltransferase/phosphoserine phosphatase